MSGLTEQGFREYLERIAAQDDTYWALGSAYPKTDFNLRGYVFKGNLARAFLEADKHDLVCFWDAYDHNDTYEKILNYWLDYEELHFYPVKIY